MLVDFCKSNPHKTNHVYVHNHSKILALKTDKDDFFIFEGSGNMSDNARIEQYVYENNEDVFNFHKDWMLNLVYKNE